MRILGIYPGLNPAVSDIAHALAHIGDLGHIVTVITARRNPSKSITQSSAYEEMRELHIHRLYETFNQMIWFPWMRHRAVRSVARAFQPDVILCSQEYNMRLARTIKKEHPVPIVLVVELPGELADGHIRGRLAPRLLPLMGVPARGEKFWDWLCWQAAAVVTTNPAYADRPDRLRRLSLHDTPVFYVPYCNQLPTDFTMPDTREPRVIYIGAFSEFKNTAALAWVIPQILESTPTETALLIGSGDIQVVEELQRRYGEQIQHISGCSRRKALELIAGSFFAFTPMTRGGWGMIGDAWAVQTPVVTIPGNSELSDGVNALIPPANDQIAATVRRLYSDQDLYKGLQSGGRERYQKHSAASVGSQLAAVLEQTVKSHQL